MNRATPLLILGLVSLAGCIRSEAPPADDAPRSMQVSLSTGRLVAPDTVEAGWVRLRVEEDDAGHILVAFRLPGTATETEVTSFLAALDTARMTPQPGIAIGGPEVGEIGEVIIHLEPGRYLLGCMRRAEGDRRHASRGEAHVLEVKASARTAPPPEATQEVKMVDFAYGTDAPWKAGKHLIRVENDGRQDHQLRMDRLPPGATLQDWMEAEDPGKFSEPVTGVARTGPGQTVYLPVDFPPGVYVLYCLVPDAASGRLHAEMGMMRTITVE